MSIDGTATGYAPEIASRYRRMGDGMAPGPLAGGEERHELLFSWFDGESGRPIEDDLDDFLTDRLGDPDRRHRSRLSWRARRRRPGTA